MGWDYGEGELVISGEAYTTASWIIWTLEALEYAYNLGAMVDAIESEGYLNGNSPIAAWGYLQESRHTPISSMNACLRPLIQPDHQLQISRIQAGQSFSIQLNGVAKAIKAIASIFDPQAREKRAETLRHDTKMNRLAEYDKATEVASNRLNFVMRVIDDPDSNFYKLTSQYQPAYSQLLAREHQRAIEILGTNDVKVITEPEG